MTHTPGPWMPIDRRVSNRVVLMPNDCVEIVANDAYGPAVAYLYKENFAHGADEANARLIAAAPALLDAADFLLTWIDGQKRIGKISHSIDFPAARAAIAQAKGEA